MAQYVEVYKHEEESFKPVVFFESRRVAVHIIENADTGTDNSENYELPEERKQKIVREIDL